MKPLFEIRQISAGESYLLASLSEETFFDSYGNMNTDGNMIKYVSENFDLQQVKYELTDPDNIFFVIENGNAWMGYCKLRRKAVPEEIGNKSAIELERIYMRSEYQGLTLGAELMKHCIQYAREANCKVIWLGVWELNYKAILFYTKWGFEIVGKHVFMLGDDVQYDYLMKKDL